MEILMQLWDQGGSQLVLLATLIWVLQFTLKNLVPAMNSINSTLLEIKIWMQDHNGKK